MKSKKILACAIISALVISATGSGFCVFADGTTETTDPAGTTETTDPAGTTETTDPAGTTETTDPAGTTETTDPAGTTETTDPAGTTETTDPAGTTETTDPAGTTDPTGNNILDLIRDLLDSGVVFDEPWRVLPIAGSYAIYTDVDTIIPEGPEVEGYIFIEWNTEPDGSGTSYQPGDEVVKGTYVFPIYKKISNASTGENNPGTGDGFNAAPFVAAAALSLGAVSGVMVYRKKSDLEENAE